MATPPVDGMFTTVAVRTAWWSVVFVLAALRVSAQSGQGTVTGLVTDETGAAIALVDVVATNQETGIATSARSDARGAYSVLELAVGDFTVRFSKDGFAPLTRRHVRVGVQAAVALDVTLAVGGVDAAIIVNAGVPMLESRNAEVGTTFRNVVVTRLPLTISGGRALENFAYAIAPGVEGDNFNSNIVGAAPFTKDVMLDGTSATIQLQGHVAESSPPMEAVEEFKVETSGMPAEYGRTGGGVFSFMMRSGTNTWRGSAYGELRNEALDANTWMNNYLAASNPAQAAQYAKPRDRQTLGGTSLGGPLAANRSFFFASFEEYHQTRRQLGAYNRTVPTAAFLGGDFSALLDRNTRLGADAAGNPIFKGAIFDPHTGLVFPGNIIPGSRISPVAARIADLYRQSYQPLLPGLSNNSAGLAYVDPEFRQHQLSAKFDHTFTSTNRLAASFIMTSRPRILADQGGIWDSSSASGGPLAKAREQDVTTYQARASLYQILSPGLVHDAAATFGRFRNPSFTTSSDGNWPAQLGLNVAGAYGSFPQINFGSAVNGVGETNIGYGLSDYYVADNYQFNDSVTWVKGSHVVKFGGQVQFPRMASHGDRPYLTYNFTPTQTGLTGGPFASQVGFGFASFLLGEVASASMNVPADLYGGRNYEALFVQDDFRVNRRLTMNMGLRWETTGPWTEKYGHWANFNIDKINPVTGIPGVVEYADQTTGSFEGNRKFNEFGPRVGLTYRLNDRLVARGAYGVFHAPIGVNFYQGVPYGFAPGFVDTNRVQPTANGAPAFDWTQTAYPGVVTPATRNPSYTQSGMVSISPDSLQAGRIQQWNAGIEFAVARDFIVIANYLGNRGTGLQSGDFQRNQPSLAAMRQLLLSGKETSLVTDPLSAAAAGVPYPYAGFSGPAWMAITPYPQAAAGFGPLYFVGSPLGRSTYNAMQLTAQKRSSAGVGASLSYTLSRARGDQTTGLTDRFSAGPIQDVTKLAEEASVISAADRTHVLKGFVSWSLPFGTGRQFLRDASGLRRAAVSGWTVSAVVRYESGLPLAIRSRNQYAGWLYPIYVNRNPDVSIASTFDGSRFDPSHPAAAANLYFNPRAFSSPPYGSFGAGPGRFEELRGFGDGHEDLSVAKVLRSGRWTATVNVDVFNLFNRRYLADPNTDISSPLFGYVTTTSAQPPRQGQVGFRVEW